MDQANHKTNADGTAHEYVLAVMQKLSSLGSSLARVFRDALVEGERPKVRLSSAYEFATKLVQWLAEFRIQTDEVSASTVDYSTHSDAERKSNARRASWKNAFEENVRYDYGKESVATWGSETHVRSFGRLVFGLYFHAEREMKSLSRIYVAKYGLSLSTVSTAELVLDFLSEFCSHVVKSSPEAGLAGFAVIHPSPTTNFSCSGPNDVKRCSSCKSPDEGIFVDISGLFSKDRSREAQPRSSLVKKVTLHCPLELKASIKNLYTKVNQNLTLRLTAPAPLTQRDESENDGPAKENRNKRAREEQNKDTRNPSKKKKSNDPSRSEKNRSFSRSEGELIMPEFDLRRCDLTSIVIHLYFYSTRPPLQHTCALVRSKIDLSAQCGLTDFSYARAVQNRYPVFPYERATNVCWDDLHTMPQPLRYAIPLEDYFETELTSLIQPFIY
jgi:hypothetical protein